MFNKGAYSLNIVPLNNSGGGFLRIINDSHTLSEAFLSTEAQIRRARTELFCSFCTRRCTETGFLILTT